MEWHKLAVAGEVAPGQRGFEKPVLARARSRRALEHVTLFLRFALRCRRFTSLECAYVEHFFHRPMSAINRVARLAGLAAVACALVAFGVREDFHNTHVIAGLIRKEHTALARTF
jgi:hypothetical protein